MEEKKFQFDLTESQVKQIHFLLEEFYSKYCAAYRVAKELKHENRCSNYFNALSQIACVMDEIDLQYTKQLDSK